MTLGFYSIAPLNDGVSVKSRPLFKFDNDSYYEGEWAGEGENAKRHGRGV